MLNSGEKIFMAVITGEFLLGILVNGFIALVNCIDWVKSKKLSPGDLILVSLAISRIGLSSTIMCNSYLIEISTNELITNQVRMIDVFFLLTHSSNIWFATVLSIFYFLKITNFSNPLFLWMKWRIGRMLFILLWGPWISSLSIGFLMMEKMYYYANLINIGNKRNGSQEVQVSKNMFIMLQTLFGLLTLIPFALSTISFSLFILSLWRHTQQMQLNATGSRDPSTEAHIRAMKAMSSFLILFLLYYVGFFFNYGNHSAVKSKLIFLSSMAIMLLYPFGHSLVLILWNSKLRKAAQRVSWLMKCFQRGSHLQALWVPLRIIGHFLVGGKSSGCL
ncbi:taste receptor type 2 member 7-like [Dromiciops gliroides]|uniref:taste receptor type 2 member 7-like n=1 Tax=Dromiciops gliroides TaxID=33562 RepID=UPI001CC50C95|nr:taste receptor type 2 member 7-like [Dromiciops gliroides]